MMLLNSATAMFLLSYVIIGGFLALAAIRGMSNQGVPSGSVLGGGIVVLAIWPVILIIATIRVIANGK